MEQEVRPDRNIFFFLFLAFIVFLPLAALAGETPTMVIEEAKFAVEQARKAGAEQKAHEDLSSAKSWLARAEKEYAEARSLFSRMSTDRTRKAKDEEIVYLASMAKIKALIAENKAKKEDRLKDLQDTRKDLGDYQGAIAVLKKKLGEAQKAKEIQAKAEAERKELGEVQKKAREMEALRQKEYQEARLKEAERAAAREKELAEAKLKSEQLALQRAKEEAEIKTRDAKLLEEKKKFAALQEKAAALEKEKAMFAGAGKIPNVTVKAGEKEIVITILAINLFTPATELKPEGKKILDDVGDFLKANPQCKVVVRGHTDSAGKQEANQALSEKRAQKAREYLVAYRDILPARIAALGVGASQPAATNATQAGRALNRRVEVAVRTGE